MSKVSRLLFSVSLIAVSGCARAACAQLVATDRVGVERPPAGRQLGTPWLTPANQDSLSHRRAMIIGAASGVVIGGLATAAYILNALAPQCVTLASASSSGPVVSSHHCGHRTRIAIIETATIVAGATAGGFGGAWIARRIARWRER